MTTPAPKASRSELTTFLPFVRGCLAAWPTQPPEGFAEAVAHTLGGELHQALWTREEIEGVVREIEAAT